MLGKPSPDHVCPALWSPPRQGQRAPPEPLTRRPRLFSGDSAPAPGALLQGFASTLHREHLPGRWAEFLSRMKGGNM